ncbi:hypothetical protein CPB83DRAFT_911612 [Crepidotus variabilis]|uniref:DUF6699 domain-containing protein n=1 Tax=Crepidotus variabilis TaxID=179855 RepID=A0A9P6JI63_9AGAR|nr:hypothetical protein CPB83DRAFT_911612 [Crepidotus variabilis]
MTAPYYCLPHPQVASPHFVGQSGLPPSSSPNWSNPHLSGYPQRKPQSSNYVSEATHTSFFPPDDTRPTARRSADHASPSFPISPSIGVVPPDVNNTPRHQFTIGVSPSTIDHRFLPPPDVDPVFMPPSIHYSTSGLSPLAIPGSIPPQHQSAANTPFVYPQNIHQYISHASNPNLSKPQHTGNSPPFNDSTLFGGPSSPFVDPSPVPPPEPSPTVGQYGINHLLNCTLGEYPYIDWILYQDITLARRRVLNTSGIERARVLNFSRLAVIPPTNSLQISAKEHDTPIGYAIRRWGPIQVHRTNHPITVGDVMQEVWAYFQHPLTDPELVSMEDEDPFFAEQTDDYCERRCDEQGIHPDGIRVRRRCDTLFDWVRFAGVRIEYEFASTKTLYLSVDKRNER